MVKIKYYFLNKFCSTPTCVLIEKILRYLNKIPEAIFITEIKDKK